MTKRPQEIHGITGLGRTLRNGDISSQEVRLRDGDSWICLELSSRDYGAMLGPDAARHLAGLLLAAAERVDAAVSRDGKKPSPTEGEVRTNQDAGPATTAANGVASAGECASARVSGTDNETPRPAAPLGGDTAGAAAGAIPRVQTAPAAPTPSRGRPGSAGGSKATTDPDMYTAARETVLREMWPAGEDLDAIDARSNALPGPKIPRESFGTWASRLGLRRPAGYAARVSSERAAALRAERAAAKQPRAMIGPEAARAIEAFYDGVVEGGLEPAIEDPPAAELTEPAIGAGLSVGDTEDAPPAPGPVLANAGTDKVDRGHGADWLTEERRAELRRQVIAGKMPHEYCPVLAALPGPPMPRDKIVQNRAISLGIRDPAIHPTSVLAAPGSAIGKAAAELAKAVMMPRKAHASFLINWAAQRGIGVRLPLGEESMAKINQKAAALGLPPFELAGRD